MKKEISDNANITANSKQIEVLKEHFPNCFDKDGAFLPAKLEALVKETGADISREGYSLNWLGKSYARLLANENVRTLLAANTQHNAKPENANSENLLIQGDNLEVLKHLKNAYREKVKMIYIDPPYNTGSDGFVYADDRNFTVEQLSHLAGIEEDEAKRILEFTQSKSNSHSAWLTFMFPRLYIARELLREDGVIFISIDDNEQAQLKMLCDEVFGEENALGIFPVIMNLKGNQDAFGFAETHEYFSIYCKSKEHCDLGRFPINEETLLSDWSTDEIGLYKEADNLRATGVNAPRIKRPNLYYPIFLDTEKMEFYCAKDDQPKCAHHEIIWPINSDGDELSWYWGKKTFMESRHNLILKKTKNGRQFYRKQRPHIGEIPTSKPKSFFYRPEYSTSTATTYLKKLFGRKIFEAPKPIFLIKDLIIIGSNSKDIVLDFFSGSGTTAHAVMALNAEDGSNRKCISVQLDETTDEKSEAYKANYKTIFEITRERIKQATAKIREEYPEAKCDFGFKEFKTIEPFEGYLDEAEAMEEFAAFEADKLNDEQRNQLMLTWQAHDGLPLHQELIPIDLAGYTAHQGDELLYFMDTGLELKHIVELLERIDNDKTFAPRKLIVFGQLLNSKAQREITEAISSYNNRKGIELTLAIRF